MKTRLCRILLSLLLLFQSSPVSAQEELGRLRALWLQANYEKALPLLLAFNASKRGRTAEVEYMIASSLCRLPNRQPDGRARFVRLLSYPLSRDNERAVREEMNLCRATNQPRRVRFITIRTVSHAHVSGAKAGWYDLLSRLGDFRSIDPIISNAASSIDSAAQDLQPLFRLGDLVKAKQYVKRQLGSNCRLAAAQQVIVGSCGQHTEQELTHVANGLNEFLIAVAAKLGIGLPDYLITIYLEPEDDIQQFARTRHAVVIDDLTLGYSNQEDLSVVAYLTYKIGASVSERDDAFNDVFSPEYASVKHGLVELLIRFDFGDIPAWLDEGIAAYFESSSMEANRITVRANVREKVLTKFGSDRPRITNLLRLEWSSFNGPQSEGATSQSIQPVINVATARAFVAFLDDRGSLTHVYRSLRDRTLPNTASLPTEAIEFLLGQRISKIETEFQAKFHLPPAK